LELGLWLCCGRWKISDVRGLVHVQARRGKSFFCGQLDLYVEVTTHIHDLICAPALESDSTPRPLPAKTAPHVASIQLSDWPQSGSGIAKVQYQKHWLTLYLYGVAVQVREWEGKNMRENGRNLLIGNLKHGKIEIGGR